MSVLMLEKVALILATVRLKPSTTPTEVSTTFRPVRYALKSSVSVPPFAVNRSDEVRAIGEGKRIRARAAVECVEAAESE